MIDIDSIINECYFRQNNNSKSHIIFLLSFCFLANKPNEPTNQKKQTSDAAREVLGFVDIKDPSYPVAGGTLDVGGEPTSVSVKGGYALVAVNTSPDFVSPSGSLLVVDIATKTIYRTIDLGGQPDSVAISPDKDYAAIAIENERDGALLCLCVFLQLYC